MYYFVPILGLQVALLLLSYRCIVTINALWLFLTVPWVGLQCMIVVFPDHTHSRFGLLLTLQTEIEEWKMNTLAHKISLTSLLRCTIVVFRIELIFTGVFFIFFLLSFGIMDSIVEL